MQPLHLFVLLALAPAIFACDVKWPNNTDVTFNWWQCMASQDTFYNATPFFENGSYEYPIHLGAPLVIKVDVDNKNLHNKLTADIKIWSWGGFGSTCDWSEIPTLGLLSNLDACAQGIPCPVKAGRQYLSMDLNFHQYQAIINLLKDDAPYQIEMTLTDKDTAEKLCVRIQARCRVH